MCGIYGIHNIVNDKWYVGQSINIELRWKHHTWALNGEYHPNRHLLRSWKQYGASSFEFIILEECDSDNLNYREKHWINKLNSFTSGYNQCEGGDVPIGRIVPDELKLAESISRQGSGNPFYGKQHTEEWKKQMSKRQRGNKNHMYGKYGKDNPKSRKVRCIETGIIYSALKEAGRKTGVDSNNISACCSGRLKTAGKLHWEYVTE